MADSKISALTSGNPAQSGDEIPIARGGANYKITAGSIASLSGNGDVVGPASATDNAITRFDLTTGKLVQNSGVTIDDSNNLTLPGQADLRFADSDSSNWVAFQAPATVASNVTWTLPNADGTSGQVLSTDGSGTLSWATGGGGGGSGTVTSVAFSTGTTGLSVTGSPITTTGTITLAGTLGVANGGTGATTLTGLVKGSGTSAFSAATAGTDYVAPAGAFSGLSWQSVQTTGFTAVAFRAYPCNTTSAAFTVTLPASPSAGDQITLTDYAGTFATNNLTINPNGGKVNGSASNYVVSQNRWSLQLVYVDSTQGWLIYGTTNLTTGLPPSSIDYLIVAGGGGGGGGIGGGGGAGGYRAASGHTAGITAGNVLTIAVGAAGTAGTTGNNGGAGGDSYISGTGITASPVAPGNPYANAITSFGGGGGGKNITAGGNGGSGGGGGATTSGGTGNTPSTSPSQGNNGGAGASLNAANVGAGGGGGATATGDPGVQSNPNGIGGNGGAGQTGPSYASSYGASGVFAGGGGGGAQTTSSTAGSGGSGGGGAGSNTNATAGTAGGTNTGGGGGGGGYASNFGNGGAGGSGIVIISYPTTFSAAVATTGSPTVTVSGGYRVYAFTGNGTITF